VDNDPKHPSSFWRDRAVLVTGAGGFAGSRLAQRLAAEGARVRAFLRHGGSRRRLPEGIELYSGDLREPDHCREAVAGIDTVFHVAGVFRSLSGGREELTEVHVDATGTLLRAAADANVRRFVHTSTIGVHGHVESSPGDEESPFAPADDYQETKAEGEMLARRLAPELGVPLVVVRPSSIYGPGDDRFVKLVRPIVRGRFVMIGPGTVRFHPVYIDDLVDGFLLCGEKDAAVGEVFILGGPESPQLDELMRAVAEASGSRPPSLRIPVLPVWMAAWMVEKVFAALGAEPPLHRRRVSFFRHNRDFRLDKARRILGYEPRVGLREGLRHLVEDYRERGLV
jgi:dihydroflavonol-4-reductase